uniref:Coiled-coil domain containing 92 n=1 Tax=Eptatretus burgeri TaxID=7764 RepID=A0A8C4Q5Q4_EPTBU
LLRLGSAQRDLVFLQEQHKAMLCDLHAEIRRLQQKYNDLAFELTMNSGSTKPADGWHRGQELQAVVCAKEEENQALREELSATSAQLVATQARANERERTYLEELRAQGHRLGSLSRELDQRAATVAYLTSQLHATQKKIIASTAKWHPPPCGDEMGMYKLRTSQRSNKPSLGTLPQTNYSWRLSVWGSGTILKRPLGPKLRTTQLHNLGHESQSFTETKVDT